MTNWKFSVFFVIALTLVAGLFADTALAGNGDGKMELTIGGVTPRRVILRPSLPDGAELIEANLAVNCGPTRSTHSTGPESRYLQVSLWTFTPTQQLTKMVTPINMNGGKVRIDHPRSR